MNKRKTRGKTNKHTSKNTLNLQDNTATTVSHNGKNTKSSEIKTSTANTDPKKLSLQKLKKLFDYFSSFPDHRSQQGKRYPMPFILTLVTTAYISGHKGTKRIAKFGLTLSQKELSIMGAHFCKKTHQYRPPAVGTLHNLLLEMDLSQLDQHIATFDKKPHSETRSAPLIPQKITGATAKNPNSVTKTNPAHQVAALQHNTFLVLDQKRLPDKRSEISYSRNLINKLHTRNKVITVDSSYSQNVTAKLIRDKKADYIFVDINSSKKVLFEKMSKLDDKDAIGEYKSYEKRLGYIIKQKYQVFDLNTKKYQKLTNFYDCEQCIKVTFEQTNTTTRKKSIGRSYAITSLTKEKASIEKLVSYIRDHQHIENSIEYLSQHVQPKDTKKSSAKEIPSIMSQFNNLAIAIISVKSPLPKASNNPQKERSFFIQKGKVIDNRADAALLSF
ncbi:MAG: ISAs1 family transposase [Proteobacteria bacterium]|nr:ISAs1 family transposase [Pseudomonadota bacterium]